MLSSSFFTTILQFAALEPQKAHLLLFWLTFHYLRKTSSFPRAKGVWPKFNWFNYPTHPHVACKAYCQAPFETRHLDLITLNCRLFPFKPHRLDCGTYNIVRQSTSSLVVILEGSLFFQCHQINSCENITMACIDKNINDRSIVFVFKFKERCLSLFLHIPTFMHSPIDWINCIRKTTHPNGFLSTFSTLK